VNGGLRDERGVVMLEFVIAFLPLFLLFLAVAQLALLGAAQLVVQHAAICGARSAAVVLDDDPRFYDGSPRGELDRPRQDGPRLAAIRRAVHAPLVAITPDPSLVRSVLGGVARRDDVARAVGDASNERFMLAAGSYQRLATALVFPVEPESNVLEHGVVVLADRITVRVSYLLPCIVPIVGGSMCQRLDWDEQHERLRGVEHEHVPPDRARALDELVSAPDAFRQVGLARARVPVAVLHAEATMPLQRAPYRYASEAESQRDAQ
jgi:hypothetical protein